MHNPFEFEEAKNLTEYKHDRSAFKNACETGDLEKIKYLIEYESETNYPTVGYIPSYPIDIAAEHGHVVIVDFLLSKFNKAPVNYHKHLRLLFWACKCRDNIKRHALLEYIYTNFEKCHFEDGTTRLHIQAALGNCQEYLTQINLLLIKNESNYSPLYYAFLAGNKNLFQLILKQVESFNNSNSLSDNTKRLLAQLYSIYADALIDRNEDYEVIPHNKKVIEIIEEITDKTDDDKRLIANSYHHLANTYSDDSSDDTYNPPEENMFLQNEITAINSIINKTDSDKRKLLNPSRRCCEFFEGLHDFDKVRITAKHAIEIYNTLNQKTEYDKSEFEDCLKIIRYSFYKQALEQFDKRMYLEAADNFQKFLELSSNPRSRIYYDFSSKSESYWKLAQIYRILPRSFERKHPEILYKQALAERLNLEEFSNGNYNYLIKLFKDWQTHYSPNTFGHRFTELCCLAFSEYKPGNKFSVIFYQVYNEIIDAKNYRDLLDWLPTLIRIMEMLLKLSSRELSNYCNGTRHIIANEESRKYFEESIKYCRNIDLSLAKATEHNPNFIIAQLQKMNAMEKTLQELQKNFQCLAQENALLKTELAEYKPHYNNERVSSLIEGNRAPEVSVEVCAISAANPIPTNSEAKVMLLPSTTAVSTTPPAAISSIAATPFWQSRKISRRLSADEDEINKRHKKTNEEITHDSSSSSSHSSQEYLAKPNNNGK